MDTARANHWKSGSLRRNTVLVMAIALILSCPRLSPAQATAMYVYDQLGRVAGVVSSNGDAAAYTYDAAGNLTSIARFTSTQVSIIAVTPNSGPVQSNVTIYGTGFSTTTTQNVVTFNGTQATVVSSTSNAIVTEVPSGATTGPVSISTPTGSASTKTPFTVVASQSPTISSFTPTIAAAATALTINGTNFQTTAANNTVRLNGTIATVGSASSSQIQTSVTTGATSGHISVTTPFGQATSTADFFAVPSPYTASQVGFTGRMSIGQTSTLGIQTAGDIGLMLFDGTSGHRVSLVANNSTFANCALTLSILSPSNLTFTSSSAEDLCSNALLSTPVLTENGTYTIVAQPGVDGQTGTAALSLYDVPHDFSSSIIANGAPVNVNLTIPGEMARLTFVATAGQNVSVNFTNGTFVSSCTLNLVILNPDGSTLNSTTCVDPSNFVSLQNLPQTGTYTIILTPVNPVTGSITVTLYGVVDVTGTITIGGSPVNVTLGTPGQIANLTFSGTDAQEVKVLGTNNTITCLTVSILKPTGATLVTSGETCPGSSFKVKTATLPATGTYTLSIVPYQTYTGSLTVQLTSP